MVNNSESTPFIYSQLRSRKISLSHQIQIVYIFILLSLYFSFINLVATIGLIILFQLGLQSVINIITFVLSESFKLSAANINHSPIQVHIKLGLLIISTVTLLIIFLDNIDKKILDIFTMSYMYEFSTKVDSLAERKQIIMNFMIFLKK